MMFWCNRQSSYRPPIITNGVKKGRDMMANVRGKTCQLDGEKDGKKTKEPLALELAFL